MMYQELLLVDTVKIQNVLQLLVDDVGFDSELNIVPVYQIVNYIVNYSIINLDVFFELSH